MTERKEPPRKSLLDLVPKKRPTSPTFKFRDHDVRWRLLDGGAIASCRTAAKKQEFLELTTDLGLHRKEALELIARPYQSDNERELFEYFVIGAAMIDEHGAPVQKGPPIEVVRQLRDIVPPIERAALINAYLAFADEHDPSNLTDQDVEEIIAAEGKSPGSISQQLGSNSLRSLCATMAPRLVKAEMLVAELTAKQSLAEQVAELEQEISQMRKSLAGLRSPNPSGPSDGPSDGG